MPLSPGSRVGAYDIVAPIGAGGMGEVFRARDTRLKRDVALKVLPPAFSRDPERLARFRREAELLAALNHPNIAIVHGLEEVNGVDAIVMELIEGGTLADRLAAQGALPLDEALAVAHAIADALAAAHDKGIIHRDLKPANVAFTAEGHVKVLDFGLAKTVLAQPVSSLSPDASPTLTSPAMTGVGLILGTAAYMSPEQAKGRPADKRSDIWSFGCVLFEMLAGKRPFDGEDTTDVLAAVLRADPDWSALPADLPQHIRTLVERCLHKDRTKRLGDLSTALFLIDQPHVAAAADSQQAGGRRTRGRFGWRTLAVVATAAALATATITYVLTRPAPMSRDVWRFTVTAPPNTSILSGANAGVAMSPDGRHLAFVVSAGLGQPPRLAVRSFDSLESRLLPGTEDGLHPFWSPDSRFVAYFAGGRLMKVDLHGGAAQDLCAAPAGQGGTWNADGTILFGAVTGAIHRVPQSGGTPEPVTVLNADRREHSHRWPSFLPDGRQFLFLAFPSTLYLGSLDSSERIEIARGGATATLSKGTYSDGHLLWVQDGTLMARPFNTSQRQLTGQPFPVQRDVSVNASAGGSSFTASANGAIAYRSGVGSEVSQLVWIDRTGRRLGTVGEPADQLGLALTRDGQRAAVSVLDSIKNSRDVVIYDLARGGTRTRFTFDAADEYLAVWSPDGSRILFDSARGPDQRLDLFVKPSNGSSSETLLYDEPENNAYPTDWSSDGKFVVYHTGTANSATGNDIFLLPLGSPAPTPQPLVRTPFNEQYGHLSPDGRWLAYQSNETGDGLQVFVTGVRPLGTVDTAPGNAPLTVGKWQVSRDGGSTPRWRDDGKELFYRSPDTGELLAADVLGSNGESLDFGPPRVLFKARTRTVPWLGYGIGTNFAVAPGGQRFLVNVVEQSSEPPPYIVVFNWAAGIER